ncbi:MAG: hypothetical protein HQ453_08375 [Actinobacteria bacterium]|nr:hypothetical protein [Actinomycetota bacterium]
MKGMSIGAVIGLILAALIAGSPELLFREDTDGEYMGGGWLYYMVTIPIGALIGLVALVILIIVSSIGIARSRGTSTVRLIIAIAAPPLIILPIGLLLAGVLNEWMTNVWALTFAALGLVGIVLAVITGLTSPAKNVAVEGSAS